MVTEKQVQAAARMISESQLIDAPKFKPGERVRKIRGSSWQGFVVGAYSTSLTQEGYCVESEREPGSVQIYPAAALELVPTVKPEDNADDGSYSQKPT